jgi:hypothetical protein
MEGGQRDMQHCFQTFFATRRKVSGRNRKRSEFQITRDKDHKPKTRKGNQIMKNRNIQFKAVALRCKNTGLLLACLAAVFISAPNLASARDEVPFNGVVSGYVESQSGTQYEHETAEITGGTGRFASTTGHFELAGQLDFTTVPPSFVLPWEGVISRLGPRRR